MNAAMQFLSQPVAERVGWVLLHFLWQGAAVAALLAAALLVLRNRSPGARYLVACCALIAMLAAPVGTLALLSRSAPDAVRPSAPALPATPELPEFQGAASEAPVSAEPAGESEPPVLPLSAPAVLPAPPAPMAHPQEPVPWKDRALLFIERNLRWLVAGWLAGVTLLAARLLADFIRVERIRRRGARPVGAALDAAASRLALKLGLRRAVLLFESTLAEVPTAIGWLRPVILLPASLLTRLTPAQLEAILAHELAHVRRHDYLVNLFQTVAETLLFYHPAVHWVSRRIRQERELCCDDLAVAICGDKVAYARALTELAECSVLPSPATCASGGSLLARIRRLLGIKDKRQRPATRWLVGVVPAAILLAVLALGIASAVSTHQAEAASEAPKAKEPEPAAVLAPTSDYEAFLRTVTPPAEGYSLSVDPHLIPHATVCVEHPVEEMWLDEKADRLLCLTAKPHCAVECFDPRSGKMRWTTQVYDAIAIGLIVDSKAGSFAFAPQGTQELIVGDLATGQTLRKISLRPYIPLVLCQGPDETVFVSGQKIEQGQPQKAVLLRIDTRKGTVLQSKERELAQCNAIAWSSATNSLACSFLSQKRDGGCQVVLLNPDSLEEVGQVLASSQALQQLRFAPSGDTLFAGWSDIAQFGNWAWLVERLDLVDHKARSVFKFSGPTEVALPGRRMMYNFPTWRLDCADDGQYLLCSGKGAVHLLRTGNGEDVATLDVLFSRRWPVWEPLYAGCACFGQGGEHIAVSCAGYVFIWRTADVLAAAPAPAELKERADPCSYTTMLMRSKDESLRMPTPAEKAKLGELWPKVPGDWNAAIYFVAAATHIPDQADAPPGSAFATRYYYGDLVSFRAWAGGPNGGWNIASRLDPIRKGLQQEVCQFPVYIETKSGDPSPDLSTLAEIKQLQMVTADVGFCDELVNRPETAAADYLDCIRMGTLVRSNALLVESETGAAICQGGDKCLDALIATGNLSEKALKKVLDTCKASEVQQTEIARDWDLQTAFALASRELAPTPAGSDAKAAAEKDRRFHLGVKNALSSYTFTDLLQKKILAELFERQADNFANYPAAVSFRNWLVELGQMEVQLQATRIRAAIALYQKANGRLPESLDELCPQILPEVPLDPFSGKPMQYVLTGDRWKVWSVGEDNVDNNGGSFATVAALRQESPDLWRGPDYVFVSDLASNFELRSHKKPEPGLTQKPNVVDRALFLDYTDMLKLYADKDLRMPTPEEQAKLGKLWPAAVPVQGNGAFWLVQAAASVAPKEDAPPGSACALPDRPYAGDTKSFNAWVDRNQPALKLRDFGGYFWTFPNRGGEFQLPIFIESKTGKLSFGPLELAAVRHVARICTDPGFLAELEGLPPYHAMWSYDDSYGIGLDMRRPNSTLAESLIGITICRTAARDLDSLIARGNEMNYPSWQRWDVLPNECQTCWDGETAFALASAEIDPAYATPEGKALAEADRRFHLAVKDVLANYSLMDLLQKKTMNALFDEGPLKEFKNYPLAEPLRRWILELGQLQAQLHASRIRAAIGAFQKQIGRLPESLAALCPKFLPGIPADPFSGKPMQYALTAEGWKIWSVGEDNVDHGGVSNASPESLREESSDLWRGPDYVFVSNLASNLEIRSGGKLTSAPAEKPK